MRACNSFQTRAAAELSKQQPLGLHVIFAKPLRSSGVNDRVHRADDVNFSASRVSGLREVTHNSLLPLHEVPCWAGRAGWMDGLGGRLTPQKWDCMQGG